MEGATVYAIDPKEVMVEERIRYVFDKQKMKELVESIKDKGQLQAGVCRETSDGVVLIAGERRRQACDMAGVLFEYTLVEETDPVRIIEIEIEENVCRLNFDWKEEVKATERHHAILQEYYGASEGAGVRGGHGVRETAEVRHESVGKTAENLKLAAFMEVDEVRDAKNKSEAKKVVKRLEENYKQHKALEKAKEQARDDNPPGGDGDSKDSSGSEAQNALLEKVNYYSDKIIEGRMEDEIQQFEDGTFDVILFDPPWGVDYDKRSKTGTTESYKDSLEWVKDRLPEWLACLYAKMAENSHLYLIFGIVNYELVYNHLEAVGFQTNRMPIIWYKQGAHRTQNPDTWPGRSYEPVAFARKGNKILVRKGAPDVIITAAPWASLKQSAPSAKHPDLYIDLLKRSCLPGDKIIDPMCGSGMVGVAAEVLRPTHHLDWTMIEEKQIFRDLAVMNVVRGYSDLVQKAKEEPTDNSAPLALSFFLCYKCLRSGESDTLIINPRTKKKTACPHCGSGVVLNSKIVKSYKDTKPGSVEWKAFWQQKPELQEEMLAWKESQ